MPSQMCLLQHGMKSLEMSVGFSNDSKARNHTRAGAVSRTRPITRVRSSAPSYIYASVPPSAEISMETCLKTW